MTRKKLVKRPQGRPKLDNPRSTQLPVVRVTPDKLAEYKQAATASDSNFSQWVRSTLDKAAKKNKEQLMGDNFDTEPIKQAIRAIESDNFTAISESARSIHLLVFRKIREGQRSLLKEFKTLAAFLEYRQKAKLAELKGVKIKKPKSLLPKEEALALCQNILNAEIVALDETGHH